MDTPSVHRYLNTQTDKATVSRLIAELVCAIDVSDPDGSNDALHALCAEQVYRKNLAKAPQDFVTGATDPWPYVRLGAEYRPQASAKTLGNRSSSLRGLFRGLGREGSIYEAGSYMHWLGDKDATMASLLAQNKTLGSRKLAGQSLAQLCEAVGQPALRAHYESAVAAVLESMPAPVAKVPLTTEQLAQVWDAIEKLRQHTLRTGFKLKDCNAYLSLAFLYGCSAKHCCQRCDMVTYRLGGSIGNTIAITDASVILTIRKAKKVELLAPVLIDLGATSPKLASFLRLYEAVARKLQGTATPYVLCTAREHKPFEASHLTTRWPKVWARLELPFKGSGCNRSRHASVAALNEAHGKRKPTADELDVEREACRQRLHSTTTASTIYG